MPVLVARNLLPAVFFAIIGMGFPIFFLVLVARVFITPPLVGGTTMFPIIRVFQALVMIPLFLAGILAFARTTVFLDPFYPGVSFAPPTAMTTFKGF
ncbi:MAG: hypothetical protein DRI87_06535 [Bacteroidetes bacterium]|nr:MAG: hypothetical protein DRI87_06535 [Bacteroidota bacterium]